MFFAVSIWLDTLPVDYYTFTSIELIMYLNSTVQTDGTETIELKSLDLYETENIEFPYYDKSVMSKFYDIETKTVSFKDAVKSTNAPLLVSNKSLLLGSVAPYKSPSTLFEVFDDFNYQTLTEADTPWILNKGSDGDALDPAISADERGKVVLTTGNNSGTLADDGSQIICAIPVQADSGGLVVETRLHINTAVTEVSVNFGLTDSTALEEPFTIATGDAISSVASDAACFVYDDSADIKGWFACAVDSNTDDTGNGLVGSLVIEDCEDAWSEQVIANVTASVDAVDFKVGTKCATFAVGADFTPGIIGTEAIASTNLTAYTHIGFWFKSDVALDASDYQLLLDNNALCASPTLTVNLPAISADTWTHVQLVLTTPSLYSAIISIGLKQVVDKGACNIKIDDVKVYNAPKADTYQILRIEVSSDGGTVYFYAGTTHANLKLVKTLTNAGVSPNVNLYATVIANSTTAASKTVDVDYLYVAHNR